MDREWNDNQPIYRQIRDRVVALILDGALKEGDPLPSVRNVAADYRVNPLTVLKGYQQLVDEQLVETKRGLGMFVGGGGAEAVAGGRAAEVLGRRMAAGVHDDRAAGIAGRGIDGRDQARATANDGKKPKTKKADSAEKER